MERNIVIKRIIKLDKKPTIHSLAKFLNLAAKTNGWGELAILMLPKNCNPSREKCYMGFASFTKPDNHEEAARILHNLYFMDQALIVELNQQPARYQHVHRQPDHVHRVQFDRRLLLSKSRARVVG